MLLPIFIERKIELNPHPDVYLIISMPIISLFVGFVPLFWKDSLRETGKDERESEMTCTESF